MVTAAEVIAGGAAWGVDCSDALAGLRGLPDGCVQCCLTSPPFWNLRDYGTATWEGGRPDCDHRHEEPVQGSTSTLGMPADGGPCRIGKDNATVVSKRVYRSLCGKCGARRVDRQIGLEDDPSAYVARLVEVFREVRRVLHPSGLLLLNLGDSFAGSSMSGGVGRGTIAGTQQGNRKGCDQRFSSSRASLPGLKTKDLLGIPWLVAFALRDDGWYLRCAPPLVKDNCMPESVRDRPTTAHEYWFLLAKSPAYFWDADAVRVPHATWEHSSRYAHEYPLAVVEQGGGQPGNVNNKGVHSRPGNPAGRNLRTSDVFYQGLDDLIEQQRAWLAHLEHVRAQGGMLLDREGDPLALLYPTFAFPGSHFATFSPHMITPLLKAATSERGCCPACRAPWVRQTERRPVPRIGHVEPCRMGQSSAGAKGNIGLPGGGAAPQVVTTGWRPSCACPPADPAPCLILDCFAGSGTVGLVARRLGRRFVGFDLNEQYVTLARQRIESDAPLFNGAAPAPAPPPERTLFDSLAPKED
jgi:hypothetical protein